MVKGAAVIKMGDREFCSSMNLDRIIAEIEWLERLFSLPDTRPLPLSNLCALNQRHDEMYANNPWFRLWKRYGI
jgi:hypothetical protein